MSIVLKPLILGVVLPGTVTVLVLLVAVVFDRRYERRRWAELAEGPALAVGYLAGHIALSGRPELPPTDATHWIAPLAILAGMAAVPHKLGGMPRAIGWAAAVTLALGSPYLVLQPFVRHSWTAAQASLWLGAVGAGWLLLVVNHRLMAGALPTRFMLGIVVLQCSCAAVAMALTGSAVLGQRGGMVAAGAGAVLVAQVITRRQAAGTGTAVVGAFLIGFLLVCGYFYSYTPASAALLIAFSPAAAWLAGLRPCRRLGPARVTGLRVALAAIPCLVGLGLAYRSGFSSTGPY